MPDESGRVLREECKVKYAYIDQHRDLHPIRTLCRMLSVHPSGFYAWLNKPLSQRALEDIAKRGFKHKSAIRSLTNMMANLLSWRTTRWIGSLTLVRQIALGARPCSPLVQEQWTSDITYLCTREGFAYLCVIIDLFSRRVVD